MDLSTAVTIDAVSTTASPDNGFEDRSSRISDKVLSAVCSVKQRRLADLLQPSED